jgi:hypothetical protein
MPRLLKFLQIVTAFIFAIALGFSYYEMSDDKTGKLVTLYTNAEGNPLAQLEPGTYFYSIAGFFVIFNILIALLIKTLESFPLSRLKLPNAEFWFRNSQSERKLHEVFESWLMGLILIMNAFLTVMAVKIWLVNRNQGGQLYEYGFFVMILLLALLLWFGFIFYRLRIKREDFIT